ncbi:pentatricopeptide repeat-containing protein At3g29230-like [Miscanthus floridulus]|uniref:pentatricopeptide repeat-containing protein At3g29230-like n=1 Tax=Miscanthus floridulus TaxID=154761 RepID=UPI003457A83B
MAPYPVLQQQVHHHGHGNPKADVVAASLRRGAPADSHGLRALIKALPASSAAVAVAVHAHATKLGLDRERTVRNGLTGERGAAGALFDVFPGDGPDVVSWTAMVTGHARLGLAHDAVALFFVMLELDGSGVSVDAVAGAAGFAACAEARDLALAREAHRRIMAAGVALDIVVWNTLLDMYAKCGDVAAARRWFRGMPVAKTVVSWNTMVAALVHAGEHGEALDLFREMQRAGVRPDDATFVAVLGACA